MYLGSCLLEAQRSKCLHHARLIESREPSSDRSIGFDDVVRRISLNTVLVSHSILAHHVHNCWKCELPLFVVVLNDLWRVAKVYGN